MAKPNRTCVEANQLVAFLEERLDERDEQRIVEHLELCGPCRDELEQLAGDPGCWTQARQLRDAPPPPTTQHRALDERDADLAWLRSQLDPSENPEMLGRIDHYEIAARLGQGSAGVVFKAFDTTLHRFVALKMLLPVFAGHGPARVRFEREARAIAAVSAENVVPVHAVAEFRGLPYIVMQFVGGDSLQQHIQSKGPLDAGAVARLGAQVAAGLAAAHQQGIVHRDVKPANIMLDHGGQRAMVTDFGLARVAHDASMTNSGTFTGTPEFTSPEQARGASVDPRSDLFSLGSVLYAACTGRAPFRSETVFGVIKKVCDDTPSPILELNADIDPWLVALIERLHAKEPERRFQSAEEVASVLQGELAHQQSPAFVPEPSRSWMLRPEPISRKHTAPLLTLGLLLVVAIGGILWVKLFRESGSPSKDQESTSRSAQLSRRAGPGVAGRFVTVAKPFPGEVVDGYGLYLPVSYDTLPGALPMILYLPGGCAVGGDLGEGVMDGLPTFIQQALSKKKRKKTRHDPELTELLTDTFVVVTPHMRRGSFKERQFYQNEAAIRQILDEVCAGHRVDRSRVYITGCGRGGHGVWGLASRMPDVFAAAAPIRGSQDGVENLGNLSRIPIWAAHNQCDEEVDFDSTACTVKKMKSEYGLAFHRLDDPRKPGENYLQADYVLTAPRKSGWTNLYYRPAFFRWLLVRSRP